MATLAMTVLGVAVGCTTQGPPPLRIPSSSRAPVVIDPTPRTPAGADGPFVTTGRGPAVPADHAWFGAYVDSRIQTADGKMAAITGFEQLVGRKLAIVHSFHPWGDTFPSLFDDEVLEHGQVDLVSWAGTNIRSIESGTYDSQIRAFADAVKAFHAPILLRFRWEMDRPNLAMTVGSGADYIEAWKHVRKIFTVEGATNAGWVWCPTSNAFADGTAASYYPGDSQVDWICTDIYPSTTDLSFAALMAPVLSFARRHPRPILIGELGVQEAATPHRAAWFAGVVPLLARQPQIKAVVYFSKATTTKPVYDTTVGGPPQTLSAFRSMVRNPALSAAAP